MTSKVILITGGNRGIGLGIVKSIAARSNQSTIIIASRDKTKAETAIKEVQDFGLKLHFYPLALDITNDDSIEAAAVEMKEQFGKLDVLINNAGTALPASTTSLPSLRTAWAQTLDTNVASTHILTQHLIPLLRLSDDPRVINISSARGSFDRIISGRDPAVANLPYSCSKACLNFLTLQMARANEGVAFYAVSPGHCKTEFNGFRGKKDPVDGGKAAAELALAEKGVYAGGFWEEEGRE